MSTLGPYCFRVTTSGAIQYGVPTIVDRLDASLASCAQKPKSAVVGENDRNMLVNGERCRGPNKGNNLKWGEDRP